jgi:hypothetical protein
MKIKIIVNWVGGGWDPWSWLRGTEEFVTEFAVIAAQNGHDVSVYHNGLHGEYKGVQFLDHKDFDSKCDYLLIVKVPEVLDTQLKAKRVVYYTNDVDDRLKLFPRRVEKVEKIIALSNWHKDYLLKDIPKVKVVYHGCYPQRLAGGTKKPNLCIYASSPDRGLQHLRRFWPDIKRQVPDAELITAYDGKSEAEMEELYKKADFWLYPCSGGELYCITGLKAQAAGCIPVVMPTMALSETVKYGIKTTLNNFVADTVKAMKDRSFVAREREKMKKHKWQTHEAVYKELLDF